MRVSTIKGNEIYLLKNKSKNIHFSLYYRTECTRQPYKEKWSVWPK